jgi:hypothetical protein
LLDINIQSFLIGRWGESGAASPFQPESIVDEGLTKSAMIEA